MARQPHASQKTARILTLCTAIGVFGLAVWSGSTPSQLEWSSAYASTSNAQHVKASNAAITATSAAYAANTIQSGPAKCNPWEVSPVAMEAILKEMVRRGWQPPRSDVALASAQPGYGQPIEALDPDQPAWVSGVRTKAPAETGEIVDVTIDTPVVKESDRTPMRVSEPTVATPAESAAPATPPPSETDETPALEDDMPASSDAAPGSPAP